MRWILAASVFLLMALVGHIAVLTAIPSLIMGKAHDRMEAQGAGMYRWVASPRMTPQTQTVVRPSPDLSYAICRFDLADGPVLLEAPLSEAYGSLSIFDDRTNNVFVASLQEGSAFNGVIVHAPGDVPDAGGRETLALGGRGLALIRRLSPDEASHGQAAELAAASVCAPFPAR